jgi:hypothetical protein
LTLALHFGLAIHLLGLLLLHTFLLGVIAVVSGHRMGGCQCNRN